MKIFGDTGIHGEGEEVRSPVQCDKKEKCPDCLECQKCSESRCALCRKGPHGRDRSELGTSFTYGQYVEWKKKRESGP